MQIILPLLLLLFVVAGCNEKLSPEVRAREDFADSTNEDYWLPKVRFNAAGKNKDTLEISIREPVAPYDVSSTLEMILTDKLMKDARSLLFVQVRVVGGRSSFGEPDTIDRTIDLQ